MQYGRAVFGGLRQCAVRHMRDAAQPARSPQALLCWQDRSLVPTSRELADLSVVQARMVPPSMVPTSAVPVSVRSSSVVPLSAMVGAARRPASTVRRVSETGARAHCFAGWHQGCLAC